MHSAPLVTTLFAATAAYGAVIALSAEKLAPSWGGPSLLAALLAGGLYANVFEFWAHRYPMHRTMPLFRSLRLSHLRHHRTFHGERFRTRSADDLKHVVGRWWRFPLLLFFHFAVLAPLAPASVVAAFLLGCLVHYLVFETTHWFTHVEDNAFDRFVTRVPWLAGVRARQMEHHRLHHEMPETGFNFNPPYLGDRWAGLMPRPREVVETPETPAPIAAPARAAPSRTWARLVLGYGSAVLVGGVLLGLAVMAHARRSEPLPSQTREGNGVT